jgi:hypothetical protein
MIVVSFSEACRRLGIDTKTLHRWLAEAELSLQCHPCDGRKKGVSEEHLEVLARLHHRHLAGSEPAAAAVRLGSLPTLPASLLTLPEQISALQAELVSLREQVADLKSLLTASQPQPAHQLPAPKPSRTAKPKTPPARSAQTGATKTKTPAKPVHVIARVEYREDGHYVVICPKKGLLPFEPDSEEWFAWVREQDSFRFVGKAGYFTAHHEWRVPKGAWRAHRHLRNHNDVVRLAPNHELTIAVLEQAAQALQAHL